jgi:predicted CopG family antitoxin
MKTITLTDAAYERLLAWKTGKESFSQVVLRKVPKRGTFGDLNESFKVLPVPFDEQARVMAEAIEPKANEHDER